MITPNMPESYVTARKRPDGKWRLFFTGTRNEVFPNELFASASEAKMSFRVARAKLASLGHAKENPESLYSSFHGANPARTRQVIIETPKRLIKIGRLISLVYKPESPSKRKGTYYEHKFSDYGDRFGGPKPILAVSEDGKQIFVVNDESDYEFNERGIVG